MSANISNNQVPEHLIGTREGLFHLLRGTSVAPENGFYPKPQPQPQLPRVARYQDVLIQNTSPFYSKQFNKSETEKIAKLMQDDEFCFHR